MKKWVLIIVMALVTSASVANEIKNGGFEKDLTAKDWNYQWGSFSVEDWNDPPEGKRAGYIKGAWAETGDNGGVVQTAEVRPGILYELTASIYIDGGWTSETRALKIEFFGPEDELLHSQVVSLTDLIPGKWVKKMILAKAPEDSLRVQVVFEASGLSGGGVLGIDDVLLTY